MIAIFGDFDQFSAKKRLYSGKPTVLAKNMIILPQNRQYFIHFFGENIFLKLLHRPLV
jgi:hypothetical protein